VPDFPQHKLKPNHASHRPTRLLFYDSETRPDKPAQLSYNRMFMGWSYYVRRDVSGDMSHGEWKCHTDSLSFCAYVNNLVKRRTTLYLIGHNIFFDLQASGFFKHFTDWGWRLNFLYDKGLTYVCNISDNTRKIKCLSTTNFFSTSLENLGQSLSLPKLPVDLSGDSLDAISRYCRRDVEITIAAFSGWLAFIDDHDCGSFGQTRASQSFRAFRHRFMNVPISIHQTPHIKALERECYYGGRTEAHFIGNVAETPVVAYDVNSMYPHVMAEHEYPHQLVDYRDDVDLGELPFLLDRFCICAEVILETEDPAYPVRQNGKLIFPVGTFVAFLCSPGLKYAYANNHIVKVIRASFYYKANLFKPYIDYFHALKVQAQAAGDTVAKSMVKIFLNSLYGKFGQTVTETQIDEVDSDGLYLRISDYDDVTQTESTSTYIMNTLVTEGATVEGAQSFPAIAAHVTEYARLLLYGIMQQIGLDRVLYCDTDSIYLRKADEERITHPISADKLGALSRDGVYDSMIIHGAKDYVIDGTVKCKGIPRAAQSIAPGTYRYPQFLGQASHLRAGVIDSYMIREIVKTNRRVYDKGIVGESGIVTPHRLSL
jgi:hypothetical protein